MVSLQILKKTSYSAFSVSLVSFSIFLLLWMLVFMSFLHSARCNLLLDMSLNKMYLFQAKTMRRGILKLLVVTY